MKPSFLEERDEVREFYGRISNDELAFNRVKEALSQFQKSDKKILALAGLVNVIDDNDKEMRFSITREAQKTLEETNR